MILRSWTTKKVKNGEYEYTEHYSIDGLEVNEREYKRSLLPVKDAPRLKLGTTRVMKPMLSDPLGVPLRDIPAAAEEARRRGVPIEFDKQGRAVFHTRAQQRAYCREFGLINKDENWSGKGPSRPDPRQQRNEEIVAMLLSYKGD